MLYLKAIYATNASLPGIFVYPVLSDWYALHYFDIRGLQS